MMKKRFGVNQRYVHAFGIILVCFLVANCEIGTQRQYNGFLLYTMESVAFVESLSSLKNAYWVDDDVVDDNTTGEMFQQSIPIGFDFADSTKIYLKAVWVKLVGSETILAQTGLNHPRYAKELRIKKIIEYSPEPVKTALLSIGKRLHYKGFLLFTGSSIKYIKMLSSLSDQYSIDNSAIADSLKEILMRNSVPLSLGQQGDHPRVLWVRFNGDEPKIGELGKVIQIKEMVEYSSDSVRATGSILNFKVR